MNSNDLGWGPVTVSCEHGAHYIPTVKVPN